MEEANSLEPGLNRACGASHVPDLGAKTETSPALTALWAKSDMSAITPETGTPLLVHLLNTAGVASQLWDSWVPPSVKELVSAPFGGDHTAAKNFLCVAAGIHDIGKASPVFQSQVPSFQERLPPELRDEPARPRKNEESREYAKRVHHTRAGGYELRERYMELREDGNGVDTLIATVVGHHGSYDAREHENSRGVQRAFGEGEWSSLRMKLVELVLAEVGVPETYIESLASVEFPLSASVLMSALVVMCDWIASSESLIPLTRRDTWGTAVGALEKGIEAVKELSFPPPWTPSAHTGDVRELYSARFSERGSVFLPSELQKRVVKAVSDPSTPPGFVLIEAPTGAGKTEAALMAAEIMARRHNRSGIIYTVPTRATADAAYSRVKRWLDAVSPEGATIALHHGTAAFNNEFSFDIKKSRTRHLEHPASVFDTVNTCGTPDGCDENPAVCVGGSEVNDWLSSGGKRILSTAVVGTTDAVLAMCLDRKHVAVKHLGMASKVIVLDEVHSSDEYMKVYLRRVLEWAGMYGIPVIALTATATPSLRKYLHSAYTRCRDEALVMPEVGFPAITSSCVGGHEVVSVDMGAVRVSRGSKPTRLTVDTSLLTPEDLAAKAVELYKDGGVVCVVCNVVSRAQAVYDAVRQRVDQEFVELHHSRFTVHDRREKDIGLLAKIGKDATERTPRIVVSTQVIEQSLDIDFDIMISDVAPLDYMIQRAGRVHRHEHPRPVGMSSPKVLLSGFDSGTVSFVKGSGVGGTSVYPLWQGLSTVAWVNGTRVFSSAEDTRAVMSVLDGDTSLIPDDWMPRWEKSHEMSNLSGDKDIAKAGLGVIGAPEQGKEVSMSRFPFTYGAGSETRKSALSVRNTSATESLIILWDDDGAARLMPEVLDAKFARTDALVDFRRVRDPSEHYWAYKRAAQSSVSLGEHLVVGSDSLWESLPDHRLVPPGKTAPWVGRSTRYVALTRYTEDGDAVYRGDFGAWHIRYCARTGLVTERHNDAP